MPGWTAGAPSAYDRSAGTNTSRAAAHHSQALRLLQEGREPLMMVDALEGMASGAALVGQYDRTAKLLGAVQAIRQRIGSTRTVHGKARLDQVEAAARAALPGSQFAAAWAAGQALSLEQALTYALEQPASAEQAEKPLEADPPRRT